MDRFWTSFGWNVIVYQTTSIFPCHKCHLDSGASVHALTLDNRPLLWASSCVGQHTRTHEGVTTGQGLLIHTSKQHILLLDHFTHPFSLHSHSPCPVFHAGITFTQASSSFTICLASFLWKSWLNNTHKQCLHTGCHVQYKGMCVI